MSFSETANICAYTSLYLFGACRRHKREPVGDNTDSNEGHNAHTEATFVAGDVESGITGVVIRVVDGDFCFLRYTYQDALAFVPL